MIKSSYSMLKLHSMYNRLDSIEMVSDSVDYLWYKWGAYAELFTRSGSA